MVTDDPQWYVQKGARVQGPYSASEVGRYLLLGRVRHTDRVSRDGELWEPVTQVPELIPEELLDLDSDHGWKRFITAREHSDERSQEVDVLLERRQEREPPMVDQLRRDWIDLSVSQLPQQPPRNNAILPWTLLGISLAVLLVVLYFNSTTPGVG